MFRKLTLISVLFIILGIVLGGPLVAKGEIAQSLLIGVKKDSGGEFTNGDLNGRYYFRRLGVENFERSDRESEICFGYIDFNGIGSWDGSVTCFDSDGTSGSPPSFNGTYSVNTNGSFTFIFDEDISTGHISSDRNFAILSDGFIDDGDIIQGIVTALKVSDSSLSWGDLNGTWTYRDLELHENYGDAVTCSLLLVCNNGNWNASAECLDSDGSTETGTASGTYVVNGKAFDFYETGNPEVMISAYLSKDKNTFIFTRASFLENEFFKGIAVKKGAKTFTNADLSGTYFFHDAYIEDFLTDNREFSVTVGDITFDGNGNWTGSGISFDSDGSSGSGNISGTYSVNSDGFFILIVTSETPNDTLTGNISDDNNTLIMSENISSRTQKAMPWIPLLLLDD
jgi:hypothetical protein